MNQKELKELVEFLIEKDIAEFELERGDVKVKIKRAGAVSEPRYFVTHSSPHVTPEVAMAAPAAAPAAPSAPASPKAAEPAAEEGLHIVKSPIVGTYYESPSPGSPPFLKVGDTVEVGAVMCIVEAMKLMNEIESDFAGEVVKKFLTNGQPVEYGTDLFAVRPKK